MKTTSKSESKAKPPLRLEEAAKLFDVRATEPERSIAAAILPVAGIKRFSPRDFAGRGPAAPLHPHRPATVALSITPHGRVEHPRIALHVKGRKLMPLARYTYFDTSYPWRTIGRAVTGRGFGTGALVGPRHLLTCSHVIDWQPDSAGSVHFVPLSYDSQKPLGEAWAQWTYAYRKVPNDPSDQFDVAEDYVVCVLDRRLGDELGWLGSRVYSEDWDDNDAFVHVGYSEDMGGQRPTFEDQVTFEDADHPGFFETGAGLDMETEAPLFHGDSGGPFFAWWDDPVPGPYVVGVTSGHGGLGAQYNDPFRPFDDDNWAGGGHPMVHLIKQAQSDYP